MTEKELKENFLTLVNYRMMTSSKWSVKEEKIYNILKEQLLNDISLIKVLSSCKNNENYHYADKILLELISFYEPKKEELFDILSEKNLQVSTDIYLAFWKLLFDEEKIEYLNQKTNFDDIDITLLNYTLNNNAFKPNQVVEYLIGNQTLLKKVKKGSLDFLCSKDNILINHLEEGLIRDKLSPTSLAYFIQRKFSNLTDFINYYKNNKEIVENLPLFSLNINCEDEELLKNFLESSPNAIKYIKAHHIKERLTYKEIISILRKCTKETLYNIGNTYKDIFPILLTKKEISQASDFTINIYPDDIVMKHCDYDTLKKFTKPIITSIITSEYSDEEKVTMLRNKSFVEEMDYYYIESILSSMSFMSAFNMLQNKVIINKIQCFNSHIGFLDKSFVKGFLDSPGLIAKTDHEMIKKMLLATKADEIITYLSKPYIEEELTNGEIVSILVTKEINILHLENILERLSVADLEKYVNEYLRISFSIDIISSKIILKKLFSLTDSQIQKLDLNEVKYLIETIQMKNYLTIQNEIIDITILKAIINSYLLLGLSKSLEIVSSNKITIKELKNIAKEQIEYEMLHYKVENTWIDNFAHRVIETLNSLTNFNYFNIEKVIMQNPFLATIVKKMDSDGYSKHSDTIDEFTIYIDAYNSNHYRYKKRIFTFCNNFVEYTLKKKQEELRKIYDNLIRQNLVVKESVAYKKRQKAGKEFLNKLKLKILAKALTDKLNPTRYSYAFKENYNCETLRQRFRDFLKLNEIDFENVIKYIIYPLSNSEFDIDESLQSLEIQKPYNYVAYENYVKELDYVNSFNKLLSELANKYSDTKIIEIMNYICYDVPPTSTFPDKLTKKLKEYNHICESFRGELNVEKATLKFSYLNIYEDFDIDEIKTYNSYIDEINSMIKKVKYFISRNMDETKIKEHYARRYSKVLSSIQLEYPISSRYYILNKRLFNFKDIKRLFYTNDLSQSQKLSSNMINLLFKNKYIQAIGMGCSNITNFGEVLSSLTKIETINNEMNISANELSLKDILMFYDNTFEHSNVIINASGHKDLSIVNQKVLIDVLKVNKKTIPFISGECENITFQTVSNKPITHSCSDDILNYCLLNKNGSIINIYEDKKYIGFILAVRNGNAIFLSNLELNSNIACNTLVNEIADKFINESKDSIEPIEIVVCSASERSICSNNIPLSKSVCSFLDNPISTQFDDYYHFITNYVDGKFINEFSYHPSYVLDSTIPIENNTFKTYDCQAIYLKPRSSRVLLTQMSSKKEIDKVNFIQYCCQNNCVYNAQLLRDYKPIEIDEYSFIYYGEDWIIKVLKSGEIFTLSLDFNERCKEEINNLLKDLTKEN